MFYYRSTKGSQIKNLCDTIRSINLANFYFNIIFFFCKFDEIINCLKGRLKKLKLIKFKCKRLTKVLAITKMRTKQ